MVLVAMAVQFVPPGEVYAVNVFPIRTRRTQYGAVTAGPVVLELDPLVLVRLWNAAPLPEEINAKPWRDPGVSVSRIITPALAHGSVFCTLTTRARTSPSPFIV